MADNHTDEQPKVTVGSLRSRSPGPRLGKGKELRVSTFDLPLSPATPVLVNEEEPVQSSILSKETTQKETIQFLGAHQFRRPRRRYEEIERIYKCGWNDCEKIYGTLTHLNAHVTLKSHGAKRNPEGKSSGRF
jgi:hypothetical protein